MPKLPSYQDVGNVSPNIKLDPGIKAPVAAFQSGAGAFAGELAPGIVAVADVVREEEHRIDNATVNDARRELLDFETEQTDWLAKQKGENIFSAKAQIDKSADAKREQINKRLKNDRQRQAFREVEGNWRVGLTRSSSRYIASEMDNHYDNVDNKLVETSSRAAQKAASTGDFDRVQQEWEDQEKVIAGLADRKGLDAVQRKAMLDGRKSDFHSGIALQLIADDNDGSAQKYLDANKNEFDADDSLKIQNMLKARQSEKSSEYRVAVSDKMQDLEAYGQRGVLPPKNFITDAEIQAAYPKNPEHVAQIKRRRDETLRFAVTTNGLYNLDNSALRAKITAPEPVPTGGINFAEESAHRDAERRTSALIINQRLTDPIGYAASRQVGSVNELDTSNTDALFGEMQNRQHVAKIMHDQYGSPVKLLTPGETSIFSGSLESMTPKQKASFIGTLSSKLEPESYKSVMAQIAPDDPVTAIAGMSKNPQTAALMLRGQSILKPKKKEDGSPPGGSLIPMPTEKDMRSEFDSMTRDAFVGMSDKVRSNMYQAARAVYAARSMDVGDKDTAKLDGARWEESILATVGPIEKYNGKRTILPQGYDKSRFKDEVRQQIKELEVNGNLPEGMTYSRVDDLPLQPYSDGRYVFMVGDAHLGDKNGKRIVIDLNKNYLEKPR